MNAEASADAPWRLPGQPAPPPAAPLPPREDDQRPLAGTPDPIREKQPKARKAKKSSGGGIVRVLAILAVLAIVIAGGGFALWNFVLRSPFAVEPESVAVAEPSPVRPAETEVPKEVVQTADAGQAARTDPTGGAAATTATKGLAAVTAAAERMDWLDKYPDTTCFHVAATAVSGTSLTMQGFGRSEEPFQRLLAEYSGRFGAGAELPVQLVREPQCAVADFLAGLGEAPHSAPVLKLASTSLGPGEPLQGEIKAASGLRTYLLLIDDEGATYNLAGYLKGDGGMASFNVPLVLDDATRAGADGAPQVLLAIAADRPLPAIEKGKQGSHDTLKLLAEALRSEGTAAAASAKVVRIKG